MLHGQFFPLTTLDVLFENLWLKILSLAYALHFLLAWVCPTGTHFPGFILMIIFCLQISFWRSMDVLQHALCKNAVVLFDGLNAICTSVASVCESTSYFHRRFVLVAKAPVFETLHSHEIFFLPHCINRLNPWTLNPPKAGVVEANVILPKSRCWFEIEANKLWRRVHGFHQHFPPVSLPSWKPGWISFSENSSTSSGGGSGSQVLKDPLGLKAFKPYLIFSWQSPRGLHTSERPWISKNCA